MRATVQSSGRLERVLREKMSDAVRQKAELAGAATAAALRAEVGAIPSRDHGSSPGSVHNVGFSYEVTGSELPMTLTVEANGGRSDLQKLWLLNYGRAGGVTIKPRTARVMRFYWKKVGDTVYATKVTQGAMAARLFVERAIAAGMPWPVQRRRRR